MEGVVEGCVEFPDCPRYKIRVTRTVVRGEETWHADTHVYPPLNGTQALFSGVANGVVVIEAPQPATADEALSAALAALKVITLDPANRKGIDPKALEQVEQALALIESYEADRDACLAERGDADLAGSREWDNEVRQ